MNTNIDFEITKEQKDQNEIQNPYAKKYMKDKYRIVIKDDVTEKVRQVKSKRGFTSDNETIKYLCDLEEKVDPVFKTIHECKTCHKEIVNIPEDINTSKFVHKDLCKTTPCRGHIHTKSEIALNDKGLVISNKDKATGTNESNDKNRVQTDKKEMEKTQDEIDKELEKEIELQRKFDILNYQQQTKQR